MGNGIFMELLVTDSSYACDEHSTTYKEVESERCIPETNIEYTQKRFFRILLLLFFQQLEYIVPIFFGFYFF